MGWEWSFGEFATPYILSSIETLSPSCINVGRVDLLSFASAVLMTALGLHSICDLELPRPIWLALVIVAEIIIEIEIAI